MKKTGIILSLLLIFSIATLYGQGENKQNISAEVIEIKLNNQYSILLKQISESEYTTQKAVATRLFYKPYKVITDFTEAMKLLSEKIKFIDNENVYSEITLEDGSKKQFIWEHDFEAYFPEVNILLFSGGFGEIGRAHV